MRVRTQKEAETLTRVLIRSMREAKDQTQEEVARAIGMGRVSYSQMETGSRKVMALELAALCEFWRVPYEAMFVGCEEKLGGAL